VLEALLTQVTMRVEDAGGISQALYRRGMALAQRVGARILAGEPVGAGDRLAYALYNLLIYGPLRDVLGMSRIRAAYTAGDAIEPGLLMFFRSLGINLKQTYGSTETCFFVAMQRNGEVKPDTVGPAAAGVELQITAQREILVRSPGMFKEYHRDPENTTQARNAEGWFHTGDAGYLGEDGHLRIIDRMKNVGALKNGSPYAPRLLENKLKFLPYVKEAVAFGDGRDRVCMLVDIDFAVVAKWADRRNLSYTGHADLASQPEVYALVGECISQVNAGLAQDPLLAKTQIHRFLVLHKELDADDGMLTRTGKLRRDVIAERFKPLVDAMYEGKASVRFGFDASADVRIGDAQTFPAAAPRRAA
jgi:long-chain acyl-CoA synthetase